MGRGRNRAIGFYYRNKSKGFALVFSAPELYLMRRGQSEWNRLGRHQGRLESPLSNLGRNQAAAMGQGVVWHIRDGNHRTVPTTWNGAA